MHVAPTRLLAAYQKAKHDLLSQRESQGHWIGELSTSALSTATAVSALALVRRHRPACDQGMPESLILNGVYWLTAHQNADGGWGDTDKSHSNIATTMLAVAALHLSGAEQTNRANIDSAKAYIETQGNIDGLRRRYGRDKTFAVPILTNAALAGLVPWTEVAPLPFEAACLPQSLYRFLQLPVVSYAIPALVAIGQARYFHRKPRLPWVRAVRAASIGRSMRALSNMQPASGGYLEAVPLTSFVVMSLAATGRAHHDVARNGVRFIVDSVRPDGSWPIDTNLATWNTTLAINALAAGGEDVTSLRCLEWLLGCQYRERHPFTGAAPGGWGWSDLSGAVPDADDTPGALLAIAHWRESPSCSREDRRRIDDVARLGLRWLLDLQNRDGGWPTFCRGWGRLPFDRSGPDLTAHAARALVAWRPHLDSQDRLVRRIDSALQRGFQFLERTQQPDGSWFPLWFGNQDHSAEENPVYGTSKVLMAYRDAHCLATSAAQRGLDWLVESQNSDGGWGGGPSLARRRETTNRSLSSCADDEVANLTIGRASSVEETALAVEALIPAMRQTKIESAVRRGVNWLVEAVDGNEHRESWPIGFYFAKLWYHEKLYPQIFAVSALGQACRMLIPTDSEMNRQFARPASPAEQISAR